MNRKALHQKIAGVGRDARALPIKDLSG